MTTITDIGRKHGIDFTIWFKARDDDPEDFVSLHPMSERAFEWCKENNIEPCGSLNIGNDEARQLRERLEAEGFKVSGCS